MDYLVNCIYKYNVSVLKSNVFLCAQELRTVRKGILKNHHTKYSEILLREFECKFNPQKWVNILEISAALPWIAAKTMRSTGISDVDCKPS